MQPTGKIARLRNPSHGVATAPANNSPSADAPGRARVNSHAKPRASPAAEPGSAARDDVAVGEVRTRLAVLQVGGLHPAEPVVVEVLAHVAPVMAHPVIAEDVALHLA